MSEPASSTFRVELVVRDHDDAIAKATAACDAYFGHTSYRMVVDTESRTTLSGEVLALLATVTAQAVYPEQEQTNG